MNGQLETERLILRNWRDSDAEDLYRVARDPHVGPNGGWRPHTSPENSLEIIHTVFSVPEHFAVVSKAIGKAVGSVGLAIGEGSDIIMEDGRKLRPDEAELGYWVGYPYWGQGLIPEASREALRYGFEELGLSVVWCTANVENERSLKVQEKLGFSYHHTNKRVFRSLIGDYRDKIVNVMTAEAWAAREK